MALLSRTALQEGRRLDETVLRLIIKGVGFLLRKEIRLPGQRPGNRLDQLVIRAQAYRLFEIGADVAAGLGVTIGAQIFFHAVGFDGFAVYHVFLHGFLGKYHGSLSGRVEIGRASLSGSKACAFSYFV